MSEARPPGELSPPEALAVFVLAAAVAVAGVAWAGAALSAVVIGRRLDAGLADAVGAVRALPSHLAEPAAAWPEPARAALPGALVYWSATAAVVALVVVVVVAGVRAWGRVGAPGRVRLGVDVRARFATSAELAPLIVATPPPPGRLALGTVDGALVATEDARLAPLASRRRRGRGRQGDRGSVAVIGPSRSGKTANIVASLLEWTGPAVVVSVKRDLIDATVARRSRLGSVAVFDPSGVSGIDAARLARWSPLRAAGTATGAQKAATALAAAIPRSGVEGGMDYFAKQAEILLAGLLGTAALDPARSMVDVARWVFSKDMPGGERPSEVLAILQAAIADPGRQAAAEAAIIQLDAVWRFDERTRSQFYGTAQTAVQAWLDPAVQASARLDAHQRRFVDLDWLGHEGGANTLYLVTPLNDQRRLAPVLGGLLGDLKDQAYQRDVAGSPLPHPLLFVVDEAGNMPLAWLPEVASTCAGIGILLVTVWQSKAQIDAAYGRLADSVLTNHLTKVVFSGCSDASTLDYVSRLLGEEEVPRRSWSADVGAGRGRRSVSEGPSREALTPFHVLRQVRPAEAVLIHATLPPAHLRARRWWEDPRLRALHDGGGDPTGQHPAEETAEPTAPRQPEPPAKPGATATPTGAGARRHPVRIPASVAVASRLRAGARRRGRR